MLTLFHYPLFVSCRFIRLIFEEYNEKISYIEEKPWLRRKEFLLLNPAAYLPVLLAEGDSPVIGAFAIAEYIDETQGALKGERRLLPEHPLARAEIRRLVDWFLIKMENEVTKHLLHEKVLKSMISGSTHDNAPNAAAIRAARLNVRQHMKYIAWLATSRHWLGGGAISYADFAAASALSVLDYLGEVDWLEYDSAREWYARIKSRPSFRPILSDRIPGILPSAHYKNLDF